MSCTKRQELREGDVIKARWHGHDVYVTVLAPTTDSPDGHTRVSLSGAVVYIVEEAGDQ